MRYLGVDLGDRRTGLALGDDSTRIATPAGLIEVPIEREAGAALLRSLAVAADDALGGDGEIVLGLPLNADGSESPRAKLTRSFAERLAAASERRVRLFDERRTSLAAESRLSRSGLTHKQKKLRRDAIAAAAMLQGFLDARSLGSPSNYEPAEPPGGPRGTTDGP